MEVNLTTYCTNCDDPSSPFRFPWFRTDPNPPSTEGPDCHGTLAENRGKTWKGREPHRSRHAAWNAKRGEAGLKKEAGFINGSPGAHNGLFGLALNSLEAENHRKFAEEWNHLNQTFIIVSPCGYFFRGGLVGNFQGWKLFRILKGPEEATKV